MKEFNNKVAVVTGAASGIGLELSRQLASKGCHLALGDINHDNLATAFKSLSMQYPSLKISTHHVDVSTREAIDNFAKEVLQEHPQVHLLFNNAGVTAVDKFEDTDQETFEWVMNINFWGVVNGTRAFLGNLKKADEAHIINVSSLFGLISIPKQSAYNSSKFAVRGFTESLKMELVDTPIRVSCVHPGGIKTNIVDSARIESRNENYDKEELKSQFDKMALTTAAEAATIILNGVANNKRRIIVGKDARMADRIARWFPNTYEKILKLETKFAK